MADVTRTVIVTVTRIGSGSNVGYRAEVQPWLVVPGAGNIVTRIVWVFVGVDVNFSEVGLDFKGKDHFDKAENKGTDANPHYVLGDEVDPPDSGMILGSDIKDPNSINAEDFKYIVNLQVYLGPKIEIDPGYRVRP